MYVAYHANIRIFLKFPSQPKSLHQSKWNVTPPWDACLCARCGREGNGCHETSLLRWDEVSRWWNQHDLPCKWMSATGFNRGTKHVAQDFRFTVCWNSVNHPRKHKCSNRTVKVFWGRVGIISPGKKTAAYIRQHVHRKICQSSIAVLMQFIRIFMSQNAAWKARSMNLVESSSRAVLEWVPDVDGTECCPRKCGKNKKLALVTSQTPKYMRGCCVTTSYNYVYVMSTLCLGQLDNSSLSHSV